jgi:predicted AlkP superfamily phosphohydrolase/phosphomutase
MKRRDFIKLIGSLSVSTGLGALPFSARAESVKVKKRVIVLGIDGLDPKICSQLMKRGSMPNVAAMAETGVFSPLATVNPPQSPVAWSCLATGANPGEHGIFDFITRDPKNYLPILSLIKQSSGILGLTSPSYVPPVSGTPFWETTSEAGIPTTVVRWPVTFPAESAKAKILSGLGAPDIKGTMGRLSCYTELPLSSDLISMGDFAIVEFSDNAALSSVAGPKTSTLGFTELASCSLGFKRADGKLDITINASQTISLAPGHWSGWQVFPFDLGMNGSITGIGRFYLESLDPLHLFLTPMQVDPFDPSFKISQPDTYAAELAEAVGGRFATLGMPEEANALNEDIIPDEAFLEQCRDINHDRKKMFDFELGRLNEGMLACVFDTLDRVQHMFWRLRDRESASYDPKLAEKFGPVIENNYKEMDEVIGRAVRSCDDQTALLVCSDHGFTNYARSVNLNTWLAERGYLKTKDHAPDDKGELFRFVDWKETKAYALGFGSIYLNVEGREGDGRVKPGEAGALSEQIAGDLLAFRDPGGKTPVVAGAYLKKDIYSGPLCDQAPDIVVGYHPPYRVSWATAIGGFGASAIEENNKKWSGDHCVDARAVPGSIISNLKLSSGSEAPGLYRVAATVCDLLGIKPGENMAPPLREL